MHTLYPLALHENVTVSIQMLSQFMSIALYLYFCYNIKPKKKNRILNDIIPLHFYTVSSGMPGVTTGQQRVLSQFTSINISN